MTRAGEHLSQKSTAPWTGDTFFARALVVWVALSSGQDRPRQNGRRRKPRALWNQRRPKRDTVSWREATGPWSHGARRQDANMVFYLSVPMSTHWDSQAPRFLDHYHISTFEIILLERQKGTTWSAVWLIIMLGHEMPLIISPGKLSILTQETRGSEALIHFAWMLISMAHLVLAMLLRFYVSSGPSQSGPITPANRLRRASTPTHLRKGRDFPLPQRNLVDLSSHRELEPGSVC